LIANSSFEKKEPALVLSKRTEVLVKEGLLHVTSVGYLYISGNKYYIEESGFRIIGPGDRSIRVRALIPGFARVYKHIE